MYNRDGESLLAVCKQDIAAYSDKAGNSLVLMDFERNEAWLALKYTDVII